MSDAIKQLEQLRAQAQNYRYAGAERRLSELMRFVEAAKEQREAQESQPK